MAPRDRPHILIRQPAITEAYARPPRRIEGRGLPTPENRRRHGAGLAARLREAESQGTARREATSLSVEGSIPGIYVVFESFPGIELALQRLDPRVGKVHPELVSVQEVVIEEKKVEKATVFIPDGKLGYFLKKLEQYVETSGADKPRQRELVDRIRSIGLASLEELWTDSPRDFPPDDALVWWEVWLRRRDGYEADRLRRFADAVEARVGGQTLGFADRVVVLVEASAAQLSEALDVLDDLAELRQPREPAALIAIEPAAEQREWIDDLASRTTPAPQDAPAACIVDTGVYRDHPLLTTSLEATDCHSCDPAWSTDDHQGHGTEMAGLALYGDVGESITGSHPVRLRHRLESVKLLPPSGANPPQLYGALTATAASLVEIEAPERRRAFSVATTAPWESGNDDEIAEIVLGKPTSWSAAIDALAAGLSVDVLENEGIVFLDEGEESARRLFVLAAGNVRSYEDEYLDRCDVEPIEDPAQAWNGLTVGASTDLDSLDSATGYDDWTCLAPRGELSPFSRTSVAFQRAWPVKPDVVLEGGNVARSPNGTQFDTPPVLQLLTTKAPLFDQRLLTVTRATSAASAQASYMAAAIMASYPTLWPETVRALIVHSAEWTPAMRGRFSGATTRAQKVALHRRYGMGVPDLLRATRSAADALTLVVQDVIHPFDGEGRMRELHLHDLPWPVDVLSDLGSAAVRLRITLSYFVEPNPGRRGWTGRYTYASHGLRFDVRRPLESTDEFRKRINQKALAEEERRPSGQSDASEWFFGPEQRVSGSLHTDIWEGTAADLAHRGAIAIFPVTGWWKERKDRDHSDRGARYSLVVSIDTPEQDVDIWTPVAEEIGMAVEIET